MAGGGGDFSSLQIAGYAPGSNYVKIAVLFFNTETAQQLEVQHGFVFTFEIQVVLFDIYSQLRLKCIF